MSKLKSWMSEDIRIRTKLGPRRLNKFEVMTTKVEKDDTIKGIQVYGCDDWMRQFPELVDAPPIDKWEDLVLFVTKLVGGWVQMDDDTLINEAERAAVTWYLRPSQSYARRRDPCAFLHFREIEDGEITFSTGDYHEATGTNGTPIDSWESMMNWIQGRTGTTPQGDVDIEIVSKDDRHVQYMDWEITGGNVYIARLT